MALCGRSADQRRVLLTAAPPRRTAKAPATPCPPPAPPPQELERDFHVVHSAHKSGVHSLAYNDDFRLIFSAGFEYHVNCWVVGQAHSAPTRLEDPACPHAAPLLGVQVVPGTPQLLTVDAQGLAKVWDLRMLRAVHTFNVQRTEGTSAVSASGTQAQEVCLHDAPRHGL